MNNLTQSQLKEFLDEKYDLYNRPSFIETDPIQIPHRYSKKEDIEISGFMSATIAWGRRNSIIKNAGRLMEFMNNNPHEFLINADKSDIKIFEKFVHRTFNGDDCMFFIDSLRNIYLNHGGLEKVFAENIEKTHSIIDSIKYFREIFFEIPHLKRTEKHIANIDKNSAAKRLNLFLMWMIRNDNRGVHFGLWDTIKPQYLYLPLDVHSANTGRKLGLISRKQNDWKTVDEVTKKLRSFDNDDPVKYDFALFGLSIMEGF